MKQLKKFPLRRLLLLAFAFLLLNKDGIAQQPGKSIALKGKVTDQSNGAVVTGAFIKNKRTNGTALSDKAGNFTLTSLLGDTLQISHISFISLELVVRNKELISIQMEKKEAVLDDVVVIGYGAVKKADLTGAVANVKMNDLRKAPVPTFDQALAGRIAGVQVSSGDGQPGAAMNIVIRGGNSLTQDNAPLYVIDGFPMEDAMNSVLNPADIESITVLKDASATAIYGARGANGVIIIETKRGKTGKPVVNYDASVGFNNVTRKMDMMNPYEFVKYQLEVNPAISEQTYLTQPGRTLDDYKNYPSVDWQGKLFRTGAVQIHNLSLSGGTAQTKYTASGSYFDQKGVVINSGYKRYQGRLSLDQQVSRKLKLSLNVNAANETNSGQGASSSRSTSPQAYSTFLMYQIWGARPVAINDADNIEDDLIDPGANDTRFNPYISTQNEIRNQVVRTLIANGKIDYAISKKISLMIRGGINTRLIRNEAFYNSKTSRGYPFPDNGLGVNGSIFNTENSSWINENILTYNTRINKDHSLNIMGGFTMQQVTFKRNGFAAQQVPNQELGINALVGGQLSSLASAESYNTLASFLTRANYSYKSKYLFTASIRSDGSSKFSPNNQWSYFPSGAFAWSMGKEDFMKNSAVISDAKLRISYGVTGNNRVTDFAYLSALSFPYNNYYSFNNQTPQQGLVAAVYGNEDLKWENTTQFDIGYDISFFRNRINFTADVYRKTTSDLLLDADVPYSTGYTKIFKNIGKVRNQGLELTVGTVNIKSKSFEWTSDFNIAFNNNKILELADNQTTRVSSVGFPADYSKAELFLARVGGPAAVFYGYQWLGNYQYEDFDKQENGTYLLKITESTNGNPRANIQPGDIKYKDVNGDGIVNDKDRVVIGRGLPKHIGGFNNNFSYKGFSLNVFLQWSYGNDIFNANRDMFEGNIFTRSNLNQFASYENRWTPENPNNEFFRTGGQGPSGRFSSRTIEDGSFLRLKTVSMAYAFPKKMLSKTKISDLQVFASAQNLYTWTKYSGMDPEVSVRNTILTPGYDYSAYPRERTIVFGVKAAF